VCATIDSPVLVEGAILSIHQAARIADVAVKIIVIDQSEHADCRSLIGQFPGLELVVIHSKVRGLSICRNIGLEHATGDFAMFWDADCTMDFTFFVKLNHLAFEHLDTNLFYGSIKCPLRKHSVFRNWPTKKRAISNFYRWQVSTSVNCVWRNDGPNSRIRLDERFGIGGKYGSCEDVDFFLQLKGDAMYSPGLVVYHPDQNVNDVPIEKSSSYSFGFGALCRKHLGNYGAFYLTLTVIKKIYQMARGQVKLTNGVILVKERLRGFAVFS
jgi:glycosyltransferase involved in cell wall biosynthesis